MKLKLRRFMAYLLVVMMLISVLPSSAFAEIAQAGSTAASQPSVSLLSIIKPDDSKYHTYIFYDINGNEIAGSKQILKHGETLRLPAVEAIDGKKFVGWTDENGAQLAIDAGAVIVEDNATFKCYAMYEDVYYVFFMDGTGADARVIATKTGVNGDSVTFEDVTFGVASDESITGWYLDKDLTTKVESVTIANANVTLYPKVEKGYWITFESNGGTYVAPEFFANGSAAKAPVAPTRPGYTFAGWYLDKALTQAADFNKITSATTVYAKWTAEKTSYTVIHFLENADDDKYSSADIETKTGTTGTKTRATAKNYQGFTAQTITQKEIAGDGSTIVKVYYTRNVYEVKFYVRSYWGYDEDTSKRITAKYGENISDKWPGGTWKISANSTTFQANIDVMPLDGDEFYETNQGSAKAYYYKEDLNGNYVLDHTDTGADWNSTVTKEDRYDITGFTCNTQKSAKNGANYNGAKFYYDRNSYNIFFVSNAQPVKTDSVKYQQSLADKDFKPENNLGGDKSDYVFAGWYDNELGEGEKFVFTGKTMPAQNITLYAKWVAPNYTVTVYDADKTTKIGEFTVTKNDEISSDKMPVDKVTLEGGEFLGWVEKENGKPFHFNTKITRNYDLVAKVDSKNAFTVIYDGNGATGGSTVDNRKYAKNAVADAKANGFTNEGKLFLYWETESGEEVYPNDEIVMTQNVKLKAIWGDKGETVSLVYHSNFGEDKTFTVSELLNNDAITVKPYADTKLPERTGYTFNGWNTKADGAGIAFAADDAARLEGDGNHLYAQWKVNQYDYRVEYYIDGVKNDRLTETGKADFGTVINSYTDKCPQGYVLEKTENLPLTIGTGENVIKVYYKKNVFTLTVKYVYAEGGTAAPDHIENVTFGEDYSVASPTIPGYVADKSKVSGTMPEKNVTKTVTYSKRTDLSYTVYYYLNGTEYAVVDSKTVPNQTFNAKATEKPAAIEGYTPVSTANQSITIGVGENKIVFYYYKNVTLNANSATTLYDGSAHSVEGFAISGELSAYKADFSAIKVDANGTKANTYPANFANGTVGKIDATKKYIVVAANNGTLTIKQREVVLTSDGATKVYDGKALTRPNVTVSGDGFVEGEVTSVTATGSITNVGKIDNAIEYVKGEKFDADNYTIEVKEGELEVTQLTDKVVVTIVGNTKTETYNGTEKTVTGYQVASISNSLYKESDFEYKAGKDVATETDAGKYMMGLAAEDFHNLNGNFENVTFEVTNGWLEILPAAITITAKDNTVEYDGKAHGEIGYDATATVKNQTIESVTIDGSKIDAGKYDDLLVPHDAKIVDADGNDVTRNYAIAYVPGTLEITKRGAGEAKVKVIANDNTVTYDGEAHGENGYTTERLAEGHRVETVTIDGSKIDVGKYDGLLVPHDAKIVDADDNDVTKNYVITYVPNTLTINPVVDKVTVTIVGNTRTETYDGIEKTAEGYQVMSISNPLYKASDFEFTGKASVSGTDADHYDMGLKASDFANVSKNFENVEFIVTDGGLTINPRKVTLTSASDKKVYDGTPLTNSTVNVTDDGFATGEGATYDVTGSQLNVDKSENTFTYTLNEGTKAKNYEIETEFGELEVTQLTDKVVVTIVGNTKTETYNGTEKTVTGYQVASISNSLYKESDFEYKAGKDVATETDAGKYMMGLAAEDFHNLNGNFENVTFEVTNGWLEILPAAITITAKDNTVEYDGKAHGEIGYDATATVKNQTIESVTIDGSKIDAGKYDDLLVPHDAKIVDADGNDVTRNYAIAYVPGTLEITKRGAGEAKVKVIANDNTVTYDGEAHGENGYTTERLAEGHRVETVTIDGSKIDVGKYDGLLVPHDAKIVDADDNDVTKNYVITYVPNTLTINPVVDKVTVTIVGNTRTETYDGIEKTAEGYQVMSISNPLYKASDFEFTGKASVSGTDADHYDMGLKASDFANVSKNFENVEFIVTDGGLTINPRKVTLTSASDKKVYDGTPLTNSTVNVTDDGFATGEGATYDVTGSQLNVDKSENTFTYTLNEGTKAKNYEIETEFGKLEVTPVTDKVTVTIVGKTKTETYDGAAHTASGYDAASSNPLYTESCYEFGGSALVEGIHAGEYPMNLKAEDFKNISENFTNVEFVIGKEGRLTIEQRMLVITAGSYEGDYDAQWHEVGYTADGLADTDTITALEMKDNRILKPGTLTANFLPETLQITHENGSDSTGDYRVEYAPGTLTVNTVIVKYTVQYYYDGVLFGGLTEEGAGEVLTEITQYIDKPRDMMFDHVDNFPLTLGLNEEENVIRVYYVHIPLTGYLGAHNVGDCIE